MYEHKRSDDDDNRLGQSVQAGNHSMAKKKKKKIGLIVKCMHMSAFTRHVSNGFFWWSDRHRSFPPPFFHFENVTCKWHHPLYNTFIFISFARRPIINYWFSMIIDVNTIVARYSCVHDFTLNCRLFIFVRLWNRLLTTTHHQERVCAHACICAFQSNLNILTYAEREKQNSCRHFIYVCLCVAILVWTFFEVH